TPQFFKISPSTPTSPNSLMIKARRRPAECARTWRINVVLPAPRKPVMMVTGILAILAIDSAPTEARDENSSFGPGKRPPPNRDGSAPPIALILADGRSPGSWVKRLAPPSRSVEDQWLCGVRLPTHSCGGSRGFRLARPALPHSLIPLMPRGPSGRSLLSAAKSQVNRDATDPLATYWRL